MLLIRITKMEDSGSPRVPECPLILITLFESRTPVPETVLTFSGLLLQETHDKHSQLFKLLILEHVKLKDQFVAAESKSMKREERHAAEVERLREQIERSAKIQELLKDELEAAILAKSKADKQLEMAQNALKERALNDQKLKSKCEEDEAKKNKAESALSELQTQSAEWLNQLKLINRQMTCKFQSSLQTEFSS